MSRLVLVAVNGALAMLAGASLFPLLWMVSVSLMPANAALHLPPPLWPERFTLEHYRTLFIQMELARHLGNSGLLAAAITVLSLGFNTLAGYAFAKLRFSGRDRIFRSLLAAMAIPGQVAMLPLFLLLKQMGLINGYGGVIVPGMVGIFGIFLVRQYAMSIPDSLLEAARIDGAGELRIFGALVLPLLSPVLVTLAIFTFLGVWSDFMWPLIVLADDERQTLPVALANLLGEHALDTELMMAGSVLTLLPVLVLFLVLQRYYVEGLVLGSVKE